MFIQTSKKVYHASYNNSFYNCRGPHYIDRLRELKGEGCKGKGKCKGNVHPRAGHEGPKG
jgi:hypothetical protein